MNRDELLKTLETLHAELDANREVDDETRDMLRTVTSDIQNVLNQKDGETDSAEESGGTLSEQLRESLIEFEARYPQIAGLLERLTDGLANMGI